MTKRYEYDQLLEGLVLDVADCLAIDVADIKPHSRFFADLDGESIDLLDVTFRIEKRFGIRAHLQSLIGDWEVDDAGKLSAATVQKLASEFPTMDWSARVAANSGEPRDLLTIELIANLVDCLQSAPTVPSID
jgi:acyl carrier protein